MLIRNILLIFTEIVVVIGLILSIVGLFSPAWQVVYISEFLAEHQHGLWWDCVRSGRYLNTYNDFDSNHLHCMYKFDSSAQEVIEESLAYGGNDGAIWESAHHRFLGWHKVILALILVSHVLAIVAIFMGCCAPRFRPAILICVVILIVTMMLSLIADGIAFFSMKRIDTRFVQAEVGVYDQQIGYAFYLHLSGSLCYIIGVLLATSATITFLRSENTNNKVYYAENRNFTESKNSAELAELRVVDWQPPCSGTRTRTVERSSSRPVSSQSHKLGRQTRI